MNAVQRGGRPDGAVQPQDGADRRLLRRDGACVRALLFLWLLLGKSIQPHVIINPPPQPIIISGPPTPQKTRPTHNYNVRATSCGRRRWAARTRGWRRWRTRRTWRRASGRRRSRSGSGGCGGGIWWCLIGCMRVRIRDCRCCCCFTVGGGMTVGAHGRTRHAPQHTETNPTLNTHMCTLHNAHTL